MTNHTIGNEPLFGPVDGFGGGIFHGQILCSVAWRIQYKTYTT
jgi:hypothetical protein